MLSLRRSRNQNVEEQLHAIKNGNKHAQNELIQAYKPFVAKHVSAICKRFVSETDDEFSIGLIAFNEAIEKFETNKGNSLLKFAEVVIKRRVIDFIRQQGRHQLLSLQSTSYQQDEDEQTSSSIESTKSLEEYIKKTDERLRREEIMHFIKMLKEFDITLQELVEQSPKHSDARKNAMEVANEIVQNEHLRVSLLETKRLPIKQLEGLVQTSRKTIERNRKYIIAMTVILIGDYLYLQDYIKGVLET